MSKIFITVSACKTCRSPRENDIATRQLEFILKHHGYTPVPVLGRYSDATEESWRCEVKEAVEITDITSIAAGFQQDCVLIERGDMGFLKMVDKPGIAEHCLGRRHEYSRAPLAGDWSFVNGVYVQFK